VFGAGDGNIRMDVGGRDGLRVDTGKLHNIFDK